MGGECHRQRGEVSFVAAAGESAVKAGVPADTFADPANCLGFNLGSELRTRKTGKLRIKRGDEGFREDRDVGRRGIHQSEIVSGRDVETLVDKFGGEVVENAGGIVAKFGHGVGEMPEGAFPGRQLNGAVRERIEIRVNAVDELIAEPAARFVVESEVRFRIVHSRVVHSKIGPLRSILLIGLRGRG